MDAGCQKPYPGRELLIAAAVAALQYDKAIKSCCDDPGRMSSYCTADGDDLDALYARWRDLAAAGIEEARPAACGCRVSMENPTEMKPPREDCRFCDGLGIVKL